MKRSSSLAEPAAKIHISDTQRQNIANMAPDPTSKFRGGVPDVNKNLVQVATQKYDPITNKLLPKKKQPL